MSVRPRKWKNKDGTVSHSWVVDYHGNDGRRHNEQFDRRREAENAWAKIRLDLGKNIHVPASQSATVSEAAEIWYRACEANELEPTTIDEYRRNKDEIVAHLGAVKLPQLTTGMVLDFRNKVATEPPKAKSPQAQQAKPSKAKAKRLFQKLGAILAVAQTRNMVGQNVVFNLAAADRGQAARRAARHERKLEAGIDIPTPDEIRAIVAMLGDPRFVKYRAILLTFIFTGMRASEIRGLPRKDVHLSRAEIKVTQRANAKKKIGSPKSKGSKRTIPLIPMLVSVLHQHLLTIPRNHHDLVFPTRHGDVVDNSTITECALKPVQVAAGVVDVEGNAKYALHKLRHFFASWCINRKIDGGLELPPKTVQGRLGHASIRMTFDRYGHLFPRGDDTAELAAAEQAFFSVPPPAPPRTATVTMLNPLDRAVANPEHVAHQPKAPVPIPALATILSPFGVAPQQPLAPVPQPLISATVAEERARQALKSGEDPVSRHDRSALGRFTPGARAQPLMDRAKAALLQNPGKGMNVIAQMIGVSKKTVQNARDALNNKPARSNTATMDRVIAAVLASPQDKSASAIAKDLGVGPTIVHRARKKLIENPLSGAVPGGEGTAEPKPSVDVITSGRG